MNKAKIIEWMNKPSLIDEEATKELREIINEFPASQLLHWLYLKGLQNQKSYLFNAELNRAAIASSDRRKLFQWVGTEEEFEDKKQKFDFELPQVEVETKPEPTKSVEQKPEVKKEVPKVEVLSTPVVQSEPELVDTVAEEPIVADQKPCP